MIIALTFLPLYLTVTFLVLLNLPEEKKMEDVLGNKYLNYKSKVRKWV